MTSYADHFRTSVRDSLFVKVREDIPAHKEVKSMLVCNVGHNGICRLGDADIYSGCFHLVNGIRRYAVTDPGVPLGSGYQIDVYDSANVVKHSVTCMVGFIRKGEPSQIIGCRLRTPAVDFWGDFLELCSSNHGTLDILSAGAVSREALRSCDCKRVCMSLLEFTSVIGTCRLVKLAKKSDTKEVFGPEVIVAAKAKARAKKKAMEHQPDPTDPADLDAAMEAGFAEVQNRSEEYSGILVAPKPVKGVSFATAVLPPAAAAASSSSSSSSSAGPAAALAGGGPAPLPADLPPAAPLLEEVVPEHGGDRGSDAGSEAGEVDALADGEVAAKAKGAKHRYEEFIVFFRGPI